jgi:hypothetical protein
MIGLATAYSMGLALPSHTSDRMNGWWRAMFILPAFFNVMQATLFLTVNKVESPYWLFKQGRFEEAKQSLNVIYLEDSEKEFNNLQNSKGDALDEKLRGKNYFSTISIACKYDSISLITADMIHKLGAEVFVCIAEV